MSHLVATISMILLRIYRPNFDERGQFFGERSQFSQTAQPKGGGGRMVRL